MSGIELHTEDPQDTRRVAEVLATVLRAGDLLVFNDVSAGVFGAADNEVRILDRDGEEVAHAAGSKTLVAHAVLDELVGRLPEVP